MSFFERSEQHAEQTVKEWIRKTLRETFLQAFRRNLSQVIPETQVDQKDANDDDGSDEEQQNLCTPESDFARSTNQLQIRLDDFEGCLRIVEDVSQAWQKELLSCHHQGAAEWVQEVFVHGKNSLWTHDNNNDEQAPSTTPVAQQQRLGESSDSTRKMKPIESQYPQQNIENTNTQSSISLHNTKHHPQIPNNRLSDTAHASNQQCVDQKQNVIPYCELRKLTRTRLRQPDPFPTPESSLNMLRKMGEDGISEWPFDQSTIEAMATDMPKRQRILRRGPLPASSSLHSNRTGSDEITRDKFKVILPNHPKNTDTGATGEEDTIEAQKLLTSILRKRQNKLRIPSKRKRYGVHFSNEADPGDTLNIATTTGSTKYFSPGLPSSSSLDVPRPASALGNARYHVATSLQEHEKEEAWENWVIKEDEERIESFVRIFGGMKNIGVLYGEMYDKQRRAHVSTLTDKQRRRRVRSNIKQRIAPRQRVKGDANGKCRSKVIHSNFFVGQTPLHCIEFDLGWSLVEFDDDNGQKKLMIFSSIQVVLQEAPVE